MNGFIAGTVFIWPAGENAGIHPPAVRVCALEPRGCAPFRCGFAPHSPESLISPLRDANLLPGKGAGGCGFAPHTRESLILPLRGANLLPGKAPGGGGGLRLTPGKALFFRREAQTFHPEKAPAAEGVCASYPGKPYSSVKGRKPFAGKRRRRLCEFAPHTRESLILPSRGANFLPGRAPGGGVGLRPTPRKALFYR